MKQTGESPFMQTAAKVKSEPVTFKDKIVGLAIGLVFIALCAGILLKPDLVTASAAITSGSAGPVVERILDTVWSAPVAIISGIIGLFTAWVAVTRKVG